MSNVVRRLFIAILFALVLPACAAAPYAGKPVVAVVAPADGALITPGEQLNVRVSAASGHNIVRIEVHTGGALVASKDNASPGPTYTTVIAFTPNAAGELKLVVTAIDGSGQVSDPAYVTVNIGTSAMLGVTVTVPAPTGGTPAAPTSNGCKLSATYVADVTVPDNTEVAAGSKFVKTWRLRNTSPCVWDAGYALAYGEGERMDAPDSVPVPSVAADANVDVSVPFTAPTSSGTYTSTWRMRAPDGSPFGNRVYVVIRVP
jgi:hypothetical protein